MNKNFICQHHCLLTTNQCYYCHFQETCCACCSYSVSIEEILTWIVICLLIFFLYNTIKLCIIILLILSIIYWIYKQTDIPRLLKEFFEKQFNSSINSKSSSDEQISNDDNQQFNTPANENDNDQFNLSTKPLGNSNVDINTTPSNDSAKSDNDDDTIIKTIKNSKRNLNEKPSSRPSRIKKLLIHNTQVSSENSKFNNSIPPSDYTSETSIIPDKLILNEMRNNSKSLADIAEQTKDIRRTIGRLHEDILQSKTKSNKEIIDNISSLIRAIMPNRFNKKSNILNEKEQESSSSMFNSDHRLPKQPSIAEITPNETDHSIQHPKCVTFQPSFAMNSIMPRVPTKSDVIAIDDNNEGDGKSYDNYINTSEHIITTNEQFENILTKNECQSEDTILLKDSIVYNNDQPDWAYYSTKPDLYPNAIQTDLPVIQSDDQYLSFKQTFFSRFHRRPKLTSPNNPATFQSSSLNASDYIQSFESGFTIQEQRITQKLLNDKASLNSIWNKTLNHLKQRIFRVRKSRIIISFDDIQQQKDAGDSDKNNFNTAVNNVVQDISTEMNHAHSQLVINSEQETKITNNSLVSLFQSFDSVIREGELLAHNDKSVDQDSSKNDSSLSEISNNLLSVTGQLVLI